MISYIISGATAFFGGAATSYVLQKDENVEKNKKDDDRAIEQIEQFHQKCRSYSEISTLDNKKVEALTKEIFLALKELQLNEENINGIATSLDRIASQSERCKRSLYGKISGPHSPYSSLRGTKDEKLWCTISNAVLFAITRKP